jgi:hypothetical protein
MMTRCQPAAPKPLNMLSILQDLLEAISGALGVMHQGRDGKLLLVVEDRAHRAQNLMFPSGV